MLKFSKGQVAIFAVVAVVIVSAVSIFLYVRTMPQFSKEAEIAVSPLNNNVQECLEQVALQSLSVISLQGGYYLPPQKSLNLGENVRIAYWYYSGSDTKPTIDAIEKQMDLFIESRVPECAALDKEKDYTITTGKLASNTQIKEESVLFSLSWPLTVKKEDSTYRLNKPYTASFPFRLGKVYGYASEIVRKEQSDPNNIDVTYLLDTNTNVSVLKYDESTVIYSINDVNDNAKYKNYTFNFLFANKF